MSRWVAYIALALVAIASMAFGVHYGFDSDSSPTPRFGVLFAVIASLLALQMLTVADAGRRTNTSCKLKTMWLLSLGMEAIMMGAMLLVAFVVWLT